MRAGTRSAIVRGETIVAIREGSPRIDASYTARFRSPGPARRRPARSARHSTDEAEASESISASVQHSLDGREGEPTATNLSTGDVQALQRAAGNRTVVSLLAVQRQPSRTPGHRPTLRRGARGEGVGVLQQKLNAAGAAPTLVIDGDFGSKTRAAVVAFQAGNGLAQDGVAGPKTWGALDTAAPGGGRDTAGTEQALVTGEGSPTGTSITGTTHPTIAPGGSFPPAAVEELQQKLNLAGQAPPLAVNGTFDAATQAAVTAFQTREGIVPANGTANAATWAVLDVRGAGATVGHVERNWRENLAGHTGKFGMTSVYSWRLLPQAAPTKIEVTAEMNFVPDAGVTPPVATWFGHIRTAWNKFSAVNTVTGDVIDIRFNPVQAASGRTVKVHAGSARADAGNFYVGDPTPQDTIPHEFGHMIGLQDEYQQTAADFERLTGMVAPVGATTGGPGAKTPTRIAVDLRDALAGTGPTGVARADALAVIQANGLQQGAFSQQVASAYMALTGNDIVQDIIVAVPVFNQQFELVEPFTYTAGSMMGDPAAGGAHVAANPHDHGVQPRHVREFAGYVQEWATGQGMPGAWDVVESGLPAGIRSLIAQIGGVLG